MVVPQIDLINVDSVAFKSVANQDEVIIGDSVREHVLVIARDDDVERVVLVVGLLQILDECVVRVHASLLSLLLVQGDDVALDQFSKLLVLPVHLLLHLSHVLLLLVVLFLLLLHLMLVHHWLLLVYFHHLCF